MVDAFAYICRIGGADKGQKSSTYEKEKKGKKGSRPLSLPQRKRDVNGAGVRIELLWQWDQNSLCLDRGGSAVVRLCLARSSRGKVADAGSGSLPTRSPIAVHTSPQKAVGDDR